MGSGGMVVADDSTCMVDLARYFLQFTQNESCGKCVPCRLGTKRMLEILERITGGEGEDGDIERLETLARTIKRTSLCGLGQTAPNPVLTTIKYFRDEYEAHIHEKRCPALSCKALIVYMIVPEECRGCAICAKQCPVNAARGDRKKAHTHRPGDLHQVRRVPRRLPVRGRRGAQRTGSDRRRRSSAPPASDSADAPKGRSSPLGPLLFSPADARSSRRRSWAWTTSERHGAKTVASPAMRSRSAGLPKTTWNADSS